MSQHDFNIANQSFPATRADLNNSLVALASNSSGDAEPTTTYANQWWYETDSNTLKLRNEANNAWVPICILDQGNNNVLSITTQGLTLGATTITASGTDINQLDAITRGSLIYGNASGVTSRLAKGAADTVLTSDGTDISWAAAAAGGGGAMELITRTVISDGDASVIFTGFDASVYESYKFYFANVVSQTDNRNFTMKTSSDGGSSYDDGTGTHSRIAVETTSAASLTQSADNSTAAGSIRLSDNTGAVSTLEVATGVSGEMEIYGAGNSSKYTAMNYKTGFQGINDTTIGNFRFWQGVGIRAIADAMNAVKFEFSTFESGTISFYGIKK